VFNSLPLLALVLVFLAAAAIVWVAGIRLSNTTDILSERFGLGEALGGLIILAMVTNLPEIAITSSAALSGSLGIAVGNILGGIAIQTVVLVALDVFGVPDRPLTYRAASLVLVLEGALVIGVLGVVIMASRLPASIIFARVAPGGLLIAALWVVGLLLLNRARNGLPWHEQGDAPDAQKGHNQAAAKKAQEAKERDASTTRTVTVFVIAALATLGAGVVLEESGNSIAGHVGLSGVLFGSTFLAASTALPELSTGLASVKLGDYKLAFSDIFGGNAFLPVLFLLASVLSGRAVLPLAQNTDIYLTSLGILLTMCYLWGLIFRPQRQFLRMGADSLAVLALYVVGIGGLVAVAHG
jgi:cation:H+ antiporter